MVPIQKQRIEYVSLEDIHPYPGNPRRNDQAVQAVANSISAFGFRSPIIVDADGTIIAGHTRYRAAQSLGFAAVPVVYATDLTPEQVNAYRLADNKTAELAEWDAELLAVELDGLPELDMEQFGFEPSDYPVAGETQGVEIPDVSIPEIELDDALASVEHVYWSYSGGRDSTLALMSTYKTFRDMGKLCKVLFVSSGCEFPDIEVHVRRVCAAISADLVILRPDYNYLTEYAERGRCPDPVYMDCVERLINRPIDQYIRDDIGDADYILVRGGKAAQKTSRSKTARLQRVDGKPHMTIYNPAYDYTDEQLAADIPEWRGYAEGFDRTACWCCPFQRKPQWDALKKCYPLLWNELREMFGSVAFKRIKGDGHAKYVEDYWHGEYGVNVRWC